MNGSKQAGGVDAISDSSKGKGILDTQLVDKRAAEKAKNSKGTVESRVLFIGEPNESQHQTADSRGDVS